MIESLWSTFKDKHTVWIKCDPDKPWRTYATSTISYRQHLCMSSPLNLDTTQGILRFSQGKVIDRLASALLSKFTWYIRGSKETDSPKHNFPAFSDLRSVTVQQLCVLQGRTWSHAVFAFRDCFQDLSVGRRCKFLSRIPPLHLGSL